MWGRSLPARQPAPCQPLPASQTLPAPAAALRRDPGSSRVAAAHRPLAAASKPALPLPGLRIALAAVGVRDGCKGCCLSPCEVSKLSTSAKANSEDKRPALSAPEQLLCLVGTTKPGRRAGEGSAVLLKPSPGAGIHPNLLGPL